jgi:hypothetical protein
MYIMCVPNWVTYSEQQCNFLIVIISMIQVSNNWGPWNGSREMCNKRSSTSFSSGRYSENLYTQSESIFTRMLAALTAYLLLTSILCVVLNKQSKWNITNISMLTIQCEDIYILYPANIISAWNSCRRNCFLVYKILYQLQRWVFKNQLL